MKHCIFRTLTGCGWSLVISAVMLGGCAGLRDTTPVFDPSTLDTPVLSHRYHHLQDWQPLDRDWLLLRFSGRSGLAVRLLHPCVADLREANSVELQTALAGRIDARSDRIRVDRWECRIAEMHVVDPRTIGRDLSGHVRYSGG
ncbi:MAG: hypothetical protein Kow0020_13680 [Wenzhouxiangellaceae bacterium]